MASEASTSSLVRSSPASKERGAFLFTKPYARRMPPEGAGKVRGLPKAKRRYKGRLIAALILVLIIVAIRRSERNSRRPSTMGSAALARAKGDRVAHKMRVWYEDSRPRSREG